MRENVAPHTHASPVDSKSQQNLIVGRAERQVIYAHDIILLICSCETEAHQHIERVIDICVLPCGLDLRSVCMRRRAIVKVVRSEIKQTSAIINLLVAVGCE
jgi:hypothetical protein